MKPSLKLFCVLVFPTDQTCDKNTSCLFSRYQTLGPNLDLCNIVFGISARQVYDQVAFTNSYYGSDQPKGTRIIFVNGKNVL